jgi:alkylhydroperoxidase family enzyme
LHAYRRRMGVVEPIPFEELTPELQEMLGPRVERLGYLGEFFQYGAHQPDALAGFVRFSESLKDALPWELIEVVALTVAAETENSYERVQHERLSLRLGMSEAQVEAVLAGQLGPDDFSPAQIATADLARCCARSAGRRCERRLAALRELVDEETAVGVLLLCGRYVAHAAVANSLGLRAPVASPLAETPAPSGSPAATTPNSKDADHA